MKQPNGLLVIVLSLLSVFCHAQDSASTDKSSSGFRKDKLFTGGSISLSFFNNTFLVGASPIFGYRLTNWADAGVVANINYNSTRDFGGVFNAKLRQTTYGGGAFVRLFPINFIFLQAQAEHNFINFKYLPPSGSGALVQKDKTSANSLLVGGGYTQGRLPGSNGFFYVSVLFDVSGNENSPYTDNFGRSIPIIRAGINIPLFGGK